MDNNLQEQAEKFYKGLPITNYNGIDPFKAGYIAALSAQSSNSSDKEVDEDLVKQMQEATGKVKLDNYVLQSCGRVCAKVAQSYADKQSMKFAEWAAKNDWRMSGYYEGNWNWYKNNEGKTTA